MREDVEKDRIFNSISNVLFPVCGFMSACTVTFHNLHACHI